MCVRHQTSGCVLQGDRLDVSIEVGAGAMAHITTQAATKVHQMEADYAAQVQHLVVGPNADLELLPGPTIPHRHARYVTETQVSIAPTATLLCWDILMPGRKHHGDGELFQYDLYSSTLTASRPGGGELFTEKLLIRPRQLLVRTAGVMRGFDVLGSVAVLTSARHAGRILDRMNACLDADHDWEAGATRLPNDAGLLVRILGHETRQVKTGCGSSGRWFEKPCSGAPSRHRQPGDSRSGPRHRRPRGLMAAPRRPRGSST